MATETLFPDSTTSMGGWFGNPNNNHQDITEGTATHDGYASVWSAFVSVVAVGTPAEVTVGNTSLAGPFTRVDIYTVSRIQAFTGSAHNVRVEVYVNGTTLIGTFDATPPLTLWDLDFVGFTGLNLSAADINTLTLKIYDVTTSGSGVSNILSLTALDVVVHEGTPSVPDIPLVNQVTEDLLEDPEEVIPI